MTESFAMLPFTNESAYHDGVLSVLGLEGSAGCPVEEGTAFVAVHRGPFWIQAAQTEVLLQAGMYAAVPAGARLHADHGARALVVTMRQHFGVFTVGGPIEARGRLRYIDGCTDTGIIAPLKLGEPCLNCLFFPAGISQTAHTHPSHRVGLIMNGRGWCHTEGRAVEMRPGAVFFIPRDCVHAFETRDEAMRIIVAHPDSEVGPTDEVHQMLAATIIEEARR